MGIEVCVRIYGTVHLCTSLVIRTKKNLFVTSSRELCKKKKHTYSEVRNSESMETNGTASHCQIHIVYPAECDLYVKGHEDGRVL